MVVIILRSLSLPECAEQDPGLLGSKGNAVPSVPATAAQQRWDVIEFAISSKGPVFVFWRPV